MTVSPNFEELLIQTGVIQAGEFVSRSGRKMNYKVELGAEFATSHPALADRVANYLASLLEKHEPEIVIPVPEGANWLGKKVAAELGIECVFLDKPDRHSVRFRDEGDAKRVVGKKKALVDDVFSTGGALKTTAGLKGIGTEEAVAGVVWERSDSGLPYVRTLGMPLEWVVQRYVPFSDEGINQV